MEPSAIPWPLPMLVQAALVAFCGLIGGSYASLLSWRLPRGLPTVVARSQCTWCGRRLGPLDLIPLLSWAIRGGLCACRQRRVSFRYPLIESAALGLALSAWFAAGFSAIWGVLLGLGIAGLALLVSYLEMRVLPRGLVVAVALFSLLLAMLVQRPAAPLIAGLLIGLVLAAALMWSAARQGALGLAWRTAPQLGALTASIFWACGWYAMPTLFLLIAHFIIWALWVGRESRLHWLIAASTIWFAVLAQFLVFQ